MSRNWTPSIVPTASGDAQTIYLAVNNFRHLGTAFTETDVEQTDLETVITDLMSGQYIDPVRVVAFNTAEHWALILLAMPCPHQSDRKSTRLNSSHTVISYAV